DTASIRNLPARRDLQPRNLNARPRRVHEPITTYPRLPDRGRDTEKSTALRERRLLALTDVSPRRRNFGRHRGTAGGSTMIIDAASGAIRWKCCDQDWTRGPRSNGNAKKSRSKRTAYHRSSSASSSDLSLSNNRVCTLTKGCWVEIGSL